MTNTTADPVPHSVAEVRLRDATEDDAAFVAWTLLTAARSQLELGIWDRLLAWDERRVLDFLTELACTGPEHLFHWKRFIIAEVAGRPAAALSGHDPARHGFDVYMPIAQELLVSRGVDALESGAVEARGMALMDAMIEAPPECWTVENVATLPEFRRLGLQDRLLDSILERGRQYGAKVTRISVFIGNQPAKRAYLKHGYRLLQSSVSTPWEEVMGCPGIDHLIREL